MFSGVMTAMATPFHLNNTIDFNALERLVHFQVENRVSGLLCFGTTGEGALLEFEEQCAVLECVKKHAPEGLPVWAGISAFSLPEAEKRLKVFDHLGADGYLILTPPYLKPSQTGLVAFFSALAQASTRPICLYNGPDRTAVSLSIESIATLSRLPNIQGIKETIPNAARITALRAHVPDDFAILSGDDATWLATYLSGGNGVISTTANLVPAHFIKAYQALMSGDYQAAQAMHAKLLPLIEGMFIETNPTPLKFTLSERGLISNVVRLPLATLDAAWHVPLRTILQEVLG